MNVLNATDQTDRAAPMDVMDCNTLRRSASKRFKGEVSARLCFDFFEYNFGFLEIFGRFYLILYYQDYFVHTFSSE